MFSKPALLLAALAVAPVLSQRPSNTSICDYYTTALLKENNATNQLTLLTLLVNTAVIGNYTQPNHNAVPGILNPNATYEGKAVNLVPYFSGALKSTNRGNQSVALNFLDSGGAAPLKENKPGNSQSSNQYALLTHLYSFFGAALGCTQYGKDGFPAYQGTASMYEVHKFMVLGPSEMGYFIQQVGLSAQSFGVTNDDVMAAGTLLTNTFNRRCTAPAAVIPAQGPALQAICNVNECQEAENPQCSLYEKTPSPPANATGSSGSGTGTATSPGSSQTGSSGSSGSAATLTLRINEMGLFAAIVLIGLAAL